MKMSVWSLACQQSIFQHYHGENIYESFTHNVAAKASWHWNYVTVALCICLTHSFNGPLSRTTQVSRYQKGKTNLDFTEAWDSEWQWHQLGHMQVCTSLQTDNHASTPPLSFLQAGCPSCRPTNSVKALKGYALCICLTEMETNTLLITSNLKDVSNLLSLKCRGQCINEIRASPPGSSSSFFVQ